MGEDNSQCCPQIGIAGKLLGGGAEYVQHAKPGVLPLERFFLLPEGGSLSGLAKHFANPIQLL
ncbi:hypothetical protein D5F51_03105 [Yersinia hibernica]|uniref:Uncharacterized protein n=2 Tax=Yersinia TaxID=629 RepID=A0ABX5QX34_9GAMM|nr:hypothetical protein LC20_04626 [Yersinia hibernica]OVZ80756.1 hypothetical protein CBW54_18255 [Yersinia kristensenii]QAX77628.1 hypothetical protein D5F51_03105 [Yersinia hibernica]